MRKLGKNGKQCRTSRNTITEWVTIWNLLNLEYKQLFLLYLKKKRKKKTEKTWVIQQFGWGSSEDKNADIRFLLSKVSFRDVVSAENKPLRGEVAGWHLTPFLSVPTTFCFIQEMMVTMPPPKKNKKETEENWLAWWCSVAVPTEELPIEN